MPQQTGSAHSYELLLIAVIAARATSFIFSKMFWKALRLLTFWQYVL